MTKVAIVDYGMGNIKSVSKACEKVGMETILTTNIDEIKKADLVILPGVGAFRDAMKVLEELNLVDSLKEVAQSGKPFIGICLGMQLLLTSSDEFGPMKGLNLIEGKAIRFENTMIEGNVVKVPQIGWNRLNINKEIEGGTSPLKRLHQGTYMYFVHSYYAEVENPENILTETTYGSVTYCSSIRKNNIFGFQFHPEKSGEDGLLIFEGLKKMLKK